MPFVDWPPKSRTRNLPPPKRKQPELRSRWFLLSNDITWRLKKCCKQHSINPCTESSSEFTCHPRAQVLSMATLFEIESRLNHAGKPTSPSTCLSFRCQLPNNQIVNDQCYDLPAIGTSKLAAGSSRADLKSSGPLGYCRTRGER